MSPKPDNMIIFLPPSSLKLTDSPSHLGTECLIVRRTQNAVLCPPFSSLYRQHSLNSLKISNLLGPAAGFRNVGQSVLPCDTGEVAFMRADNPSIFPSLPQSRDLCVTTVTQHAYINGQQYPKTAL